MDLRTKRRPGIAWPSAYVARGVVIGAFRRTAYSSVVFRLADAETFDAVKASLESDPRLTLEAKREVRFYEEQSEALAKFISILGTTLSVIFSIGSDGRRSLGSGKCRTSRIPMARAG